MNGECMPHGPPNIRIAVPPSWGDMTGAVDEARRYAEEAQQAADGMDIATLQDIDRIFEEG